MSFKFGAQCHRPTCTMLCTVGIRSHDIPAPLHRSPRVSRTVPQHCGGGSYERMGHEVCKATALLTNRTGFIIACFLAASRTPGRRSGASLCNLRTAHNLSHPFFPSNNPDSVLRSNVTVRNSNLPPTLRLLILQWICHLCLTFPLIQGLNSAVGASVRHSFQI